MGRATWKHTNVARFSSEIRSVTALPGPSTSHCKERPVGSDTKPCRAVNFSELVHAGTHFTCYVSLLRCAVLGGRGEGGRGDPERTEAPKHHTEPQLRTGCPELLPKRPPTALAERTCDEQRGIGDESSGNCLYLSFVWGLFNLCHGITKSRNPH